MFTGINNLDKEDLFEINKGPRMRKKESELDGHKGFFVGNFGSKLPKLCEAKYVQNKVKYLNRLKTEKEATL